MLLYGKGNGVNRPSQAFVPKKTCCSSKATFLERKKKLKKLWNLVKSLSCYDIMKYFINLGISDNVLERILWSLSRLVFFFFFFFVAGPFTFLRITLLKTESFWPKKPQIPPITQETERTTILIWKASRWTAVILEFVTDVFIATFWPPSGWVIFQESLKSAFKGYFHYHVHPYLLPLGKKKNYNTLRWYHICDD